MSKNVIFRFVSIIMVIAMVMGMALTCFATEDSDGKCEIKVEKYFQEEDNEEVYTLDERYTIAERYKPNYVDVLTSGHNGYEIDRYEVITDGLVNEIEVEKTNASIRFYLGQDTLVKLYYKLNTVGCIFEYYFQDKIDGSSYTMKNTETVAFKGKNRQLDVVIPEYEGYEFCRYETNVFQNWIFENEISVIVENNDLVLKIFYNLKPSAKYTVQHILYDSNTGAWNEVMEDREESEGEVGTKVSASPNEYEGYFYDEELSCSSDIVKKDGSLELKLYYHPIIVKYMVSHWLAQDDGDYKEVIEDREVKYGEVGTIVTATPNEYEGYYCNEEMSYPSGEIGKYSMLLLDIFYDKEVEPEPTEPEPTESEPTEPEVTEPEVTEPEVTEPEVTEPNVVNPDNYDSTVPKTGDSNDSGIYITMFVLSLIGAVTLFLYGKKLKAKN